MIEEKKKQEENTDHHKERRREETRDWSNLSNIKSLKRMDKEPTKITMTNKSVDAEKSRPKSIHSKQSVAYNNRDTSGESSPESDAEDEFAERGRQDQSDLPSEYWQIQKLVKYLKVSYLLLCLMFILEKKWI